MGIDKGILVGIDLAEDHVQVCCTGSDGELTSVSILSDPSKFRIPLVLCAIEDSTEWLYGEEADATVEGEKIKKIENLLKLASEDKGMEIFGRMYPADILLERYLRRLFSAIKEKASATGIRGVVVTLKRCGRILRRNLMSAFELLGISSDNVRIISHIESFMYYVVSQNCDIWINDVGLFDFDEESFTFYKLSFGRKQKPVNVVAEKSDLTENVNFKMLDTGDREWLVGAFEDSVSLMLHKQIISALYFTGIGFESPWADTSMKKFCTNRRIFKGQNLYVRGAGCAAKLIYDGGDDEYSFIADDVLRSSICIRVYKDGHYEEMPIANIGDPYNDIFANIEVIMEKTNELDLIVHNVLKKDFICAIMTLDTLNLRNDRSTRLDVRIRFPERDVCVITVRDMGFGEIYKTDHKIWEQVLKI
ncbi:MAG: hypothetical protein K6E85_08775 [Lachnospiraceae bacterium]|nr:hypothetical protein [Lachnospiraceae bacterium]